MMHTIMSVMFVVAVIAAFWVVTSLRVVLFNAVKFPLVLVGKLVGFTNNDKLSGFFMSTSSSVVDLNDKASSSIHSVKNKALDTKLATDGTEWIKANNKTMSRMYDSMFQ